MQKLCELDHRLGSILDFIEFNRSKNKCYLYPIPAVHNKGLEKEIGELAYIDEKSKKPFFVCLHNDDFPEILFTHYYKLYPSTYDTWKCDNGINITADNWKLWKNTDEDKKYTVYDSSSRERNYTNVIKMLFYIGISSEHNGCLEPGWNNEETEKSRNKYLGKIEFTMDDF